MEEMAPKIFEQELWRNICSQRNVVSTINLPISLLMLLLSLNHWQELGKGPFNILRSNWEMMWYHSSLSFQIFQVVIGVGGIGLLCAMVAKAAGAGRVIAVDISAHARYFVEKCVNFQGKCFKKWCHTCCRSSSWKCQRRDL
jgi:hypothetical protein